MKRYEVLLNGTPAGFVETVDETSAVSEAYKLHPGDPKVSLTLRRDTQAMNVLIDTTNWRVLARHDSHKALAALAVIQFNNVDSVILRGSENRVYAAFDQTQLAAIGANMGLDLSSLPGLTDRIRALRSAIEGAAWLTLPFTTAQLEAQAYVIDPRFDQPLAFDPTSEDMPKDLKAWHVEPQRNRARQDSPHWHMFAAGLGYGAGVTTPETLEHMGEAAPDAAPSGARRSAPKRPPATPAAPKAPKPPRAPGAPATRPAAGTSTGKVWEAADAVHAKDPDLRGKELKAAVMAACAELGINAGTCNVQFGKWKSSVGL